jgi:urease accessory protein
VHAGAAAVVDADGRLRQLTSAPPLTLRRVHGPGCALCLVGTAAGPLDGDELALSLDVRGPTTLTATGASIAQGGTSTLTIRAVVTGAELCADPGPLIVCAGAHVDVTVDLALDAGASVTWRELLVLGRSNEPPGTATLTWNVTRDGAPLLRQYVDLADPELTAWPGQLRGTRALATTLRVGPDVEARTVVHSPTDVSQRLADHAELRTSLGQVARA